MGRRRKKKRSQPAVPKTPSPQPVAAPAAPGASQGRWPRAVAVMAILVAIGLGSFALWRALGPNGSFTPRPMNIVVVTADTLRADKLGTYGNRDIATPNIDRLAASGVVFANATTVAPITLPAHTSIFTGTYPMYHGVRDNGGYYLDPRHETLAESLRKVGYATGAFVGAFVLDSRWGLDQGFDRYFDDFDVAGHENAPGNSAYRRGGEVLAEALDWMGSIEDAPFLSWIHLYDPHRPYDPPEPFKTEYADAAWGGYDGEVAYVDSLMGELLKWLDARGLTESTIVVFIGDHGESLGDHDELTHGFFVYDATMQVPFIMSAASDALRGRRVAEQVRVIDMMPTLLEMVGVEVPQDVQGANLLPLARGRHDDSELESYGESLLPQHYGWSPLYALRTNELHFIDAPRPELFDVTKDPAEQHNLASQRAGTVRELRERLEALRERYALDESMERARAVPDSETRDRLAALGYLSTESSRPRDPAQPLADPKDKIALFTLIREAATDSDAGRFDQALAKLERAIREDPDIPEAYHLLGKAHAEGNDRQAATNAFQRALAIDPEYKPALFSLAQTYLDMGRPDEAAAGFERLLELDPSATQASFMLAEIHIEAQRLDAARAILEGLDDPRSDGERAVRHSLLAEVHLGANQLDDAETELRRAAELSAELPDVHYNLGLVAEQRGETDEALQHYEKELAVNPASYRAHFNIAKLDGQAGRTQQMFEHLEKTIALGPSFAIGHLYLANAYLEAGQLERAAELARRGIDLQPEPAFAPLGHFILADAYQALGRNQDAAREMALGQKLQSAIAP